MRHLIIGAGATLAEALNLGCTPEICPPLIKDFAQKTWEEFSPHPVLEAFLEKHNLDYDEEDPRLAFYEYENNGITNIEKFLEFAWLHRDKEWVVDNNKLPRGYISGLRITEHQPDRLKKPKQQKTSFWDDLMYSGIGIPISMLMGRCFLENGVGWKDLALSKLIATRLAPIDLVLNLNYDTVFELALEQLGMDFVYSPVQSNGRQIVVAKPHGSLNMVTNEKGFTFGQPEWLGTPQPAGFKSYSGIIPPIFNKNYTDHPIAKMIIRSIRKRSPQKIIMWGVGLTESDIGLASLYRNWSRQVSQVDVINPSTESAEKASDVFGCSARHFVSVEQWVAGK